MVRFRVTEIQKRVTTSFAREVKSIILYIAAADATSSELRTFLNIVSAPPIDEPPPKLDSE